VLIYLVTAAMDAREWWNLASYFLSSWMIVIFFPFIVAILPKRFRENKIATWIYLLIGSFLLLLLAFSMTVKLFFEFFFSA
jgi:putative effector of murein hydrolase LrgA (UPF0299 family)